MACCTGLTMSLLITTRCFGFVSAISSANRGMPASHCRLPICGRQVVDRRASKIHQPAALRSEEPQERHARWHVRFAERRSERGLGCAVEVRVCPIEVSALRRRRLADEQGDYLPGPILVPQAGDAALRVCRGDAGGRFCDCCGWHAGNIAGRTYRPVICRLPLRGGGGPCRPCCASWPTRSCGSASP